MNLYLLVEGERTEKKVYRAWIAHVFPNLEQVYRIEDIKDNHFFLLAGYGYPSYLQRIPTALTDIKRHGNIDHFLICVDAEENTVEAKRAEIQEIISKSTDFAPCHIIIHNCCMETWFLGNRKIFRPHPHSKKLVEFIRFYDVSRDDPEEMGCPSDYPTRAQFHDEYLKEIFRERGLSYNKRRPAEVIERYYFNELIKRNTKTGHLATFGELIELWKTLGGRL